MLCNQEEKNRNSVKELILELATKQDLLKDKDSRKRFYVQLEDIYNEQIDNENTFRHYYSDIYSALMSIHNDSSKGDINIVGQNLALIRKNYKQSSPSKNISRQINKLYDHVSLEIARITYVDAINWKASGEERFRNVEAQLTKIENDSKELFNGIDNNYDSLKQKIDAQKESVENQKREYIAILGIFAAIVLAFTTGITFSTSVLNNIDSVSMYRLVLIVLIMGVVLINIMYGLFYYIDRIVIKAKPKSLKPLFITNILFIVMIIITIVLWSFGYIEQRNERINKVYAMEVELNE